MSRVFHQIAIGQQSHGAFIGSRSAGCQARLELQEALDQHAKVELDFTGLHMVTQSFVDELVGVLILEYSPDILQRIEFKGCNEAIQTVVRYVVNSRTRDYLHRQGAALIAH